MYLSNSADSEIKHNVIIGVGRSIGISMPDYTDMTVSSNTITNVYHGIRKHHYHESYEGHASTFQRGKAIITSNKIIEVKRSQSDTLDKRDGYRITWEIAKNSPDRATDIVLSPDGVTLAVGSRLGYIRLFNIQTRDLKNVIYDTDNGIKALAYSPDGTILASAGSQAIIKLWDTKTAKLLRVITGHKTTISSLAFSPDGKLLASGSQDRSIKLWDYPAGKLIHTFHAKYSRITDLGEELSIYAIAFSPDSKLLATSVVGGTQIWQLTNKKILHQFSGNFRGNPFSPDGRIIALDTIGEGVVLYSVSDAKVLNVLRDKSGDDAIRFSPDGTMIATAGISGINIWDVDTGSVKQSLSLRSGDLDAQTIIFSNDSKRLISSDLTNSIDGRAHRSDTQAPYIRIWDVSTASELFPEKQPHVYSYKNHKKHLFNQIGPIALSPNGNIIATNNILRDSISLNQKFRLQGENTQAVAFSSDGQLVAFGQNGSVITLLELKTKQGIKHLEILNKVGKPQVHTFKHLAFSTNSEFLAISYEFNTSKWVKNQAIRIIELKAGKIIWEQIFTKEDLGRYCNIIGIKFVKNNILNFICYDTGGIDLYSINVSSGKLSLPVVLVPINTSSPFSTPHTSFSANGNLMALYYELYNPDREKYPNIYQPPPRVNGNKSSYGPAVYKIQVWELDNKKIRFDAYDSFPHDTSTRSLPVALSPDGKQLATGGILSTVWLWDMVTKQKLYSLKHHAPRELSPIEYLLFSSNGKYVYSLVRNSLRGVTGPRIFNLLTRKELSETKISPDNN
jgi:WD40 repeat protein